jgi:hypothetical protein
MLCVTGSWFTRSHFKLLIAQSGEIAREVGTVPRLVPFLVVLPASSD